MDTPSHPFPCLKLNIVFPYKHLTPAVKKVGGGAIVQSSFVAKELGHVAVMELTMNSSVYRSKISSSKSTTEWLKKKNQVVAMAPFSKPRPQPD